MTENNRVIPYADAARARRSRNRGSASRNARAGNARASVKASARTGREAAAKATARSTRSAARRTSWRTTVNRMLENPRLVITATFLCALLVVGAFMYGPTRTYYQAVREEQRLEAERTAVIDRNLQLAQQNADLQTNEGIMQEAREELGWVMPGENVVIVYGADIEHDSGVNADVVSGSVKPPVTWYSPVLDVIFGVK